MTVVYEDEWVTLHHADYRDVLDTSSDDALVADAVITDPPYGETSLDWDQWPKGWLRDAAHITDALWCWGSFRMFHDHADEFAEWKRFGLSIGFGVVESGPLVRSSYHADEQSARYTGAEALHTAAP